MKKAIFTVAVSSMLATVAWAQNQPYITRVYDFQPAPGQFVNTMPQYKTGEPRDSVVARASKALCGYWDIDDGDTLGMVYKPGMVSLGSYGGYVVFGFDQFDGFTGRQQRAWHCDGELRREPQRRARRPVV